MSCGRARRTRPVQARATAALLARLAARHCAGSVHAHGTEERRASAAPIRPKAAKQQLLAVVHWTRRAYTVSMMCAARSKRASLVGVAGMVPELDHVLAVQRVAPQRPLTHPAPATRLSRQAFAAEAELGVPLTLERFIRWTSRLDSCTRAQCAGAGIRMRGHGYAARGRERYTEFARRASEPSVAALGLPDMQQAGNPTLYRRLRRVPRGATAREQMRQASENVASRRKSFAGWIRTRRLPAGRGYRTQELTT